MNKTKLINLCVAATFRLRPRRLKPAATSCGYIALVIACLILPVLTGCKTRLAQGGAYAPGTTTITTDLNGVTSTNFVATAAPDKAFYLVDADYDLAYATLDAAFTFEKENRDALWKVSPEIKHTLDSIRPQAWIVNLQWAAARKVYAANPIPAGLSNLQTYLAQIKNLATAAQAAIAAGKPK